MSQNGAQMGDRRLHTRRVRPGDFVPWQVRPRGLGPRLLEPSESSPLGKLDPRKVRPRKVRPPQISEGALLAGTESSIERKKNRSQKRQKWGFLAAKIRIYMERILLSCTLT